MDNQELFSTIGNVDDVYLLELEQPKLRRLPNHFGLIAALIALLLTACSAPVIVRSFDKIQTAHRSDTGRGCEVYVMVGGSRQWKYEGFRSYDAEVQVVVEQDAPKNLDTQYFPVRLMDFCTPEKWEVTENAIFVDFSMNVPKDGKIYGIQYRQYTLPSDGAVTVPGILGAFFLEQDTRNYGNAEAVIFHGGINYPKTPDSTREKPGNLSGNIYSQIIFWSDGYYLYCLKLPLTYNLPVTEVEGIVTSLTAVEDISQYLTS